MEVAGLLAAVAVERLKIEVRHQYRRLSESVEEAIERLPDDRTTAECTGNILCERIGVRHKADCLGKTPPFDQYAKELGSL